MNQNIGSEIYDFAVELWPINRSLTGNGNRKTLKLIQNKIPELKIHSIASGSKVFDWTVPDEWNVKNAWVKDDEGNTICNYKENNVCLVGYSTSVNKKLTKQELLKHIFSLPSQPNAIPYVTSYYHKNWGFCISENQKNNLKEGNYHVFIDSTHKKGNLNYGEVIVKGKSKKEIFFLHIFVTHLSLIMSYLDLLF